MRCLENVVGQTIGITQDLPLYAMSPSPTSSISMSLQLFIVIRAEICKMADDISSEQKRLDRQIRSLTISSFEQTTYVSDCALP